MRSSANLPPVPAKRYFSLPEVCELAQIRPEQLAEWQSRNGSLRQGGNAFTRTDVMQIRQLHHGISDYFAQDYLDEEGRPVIAAPQMRQELQDLLYKIEKALAI